MERKVGKARRPQFVLFGSSIVEYSYGNEGWGAHLANLYARKADILLRGYAGWNSRDALKVVAQAFPKDAAEQPSLIVVYFGGNDSMHVKPPGYDPHVPLDEYIDNMKKIAGYLQSLSEKTRLIFLSVPPVNEEMIAELSGGHAIRTNEECQKYSEACLALCQEMGVKAIDLFNAIQQREDWKDVCFVDGLHLSAEGSRIVGKEILSVLEKAEWEPSLYWNSMPSEFAGISPVDRVDEINSQIQ